MIKKVSGNGIMGNAVRTVGSPPHVLEKTGVKPTSVEAVFTGVGHGPDDLAEYPSEVTFESSAILKAMHLDTLKAMHLDTLLATR